MKWTPDLLAKVTFYSTEIGGRKGVTPHDIFGCPLEFDNEYFDARFDLTESGEVKPGTTVNLPVKFLNKELVKQKLSVGVKFKLWESGTIGEGEILEVF